MSYMCESKNRVKMQKKMPTNLGPSSYFVHYSEFVNFVCSLDVLSGSGLERVVSISWQWEIDDPS